ncbi:MAG: transcriptional regulator GutM [Chloroflexi bacterium]|nr:transcriptional regulator GutM [Chloroflexota bacterium]
MNWKHFLLFIAAAWGLQAILTMVQMQNYRRRFSELAALAKDGYLGAGSSAGRISAGVVVLLTTDANGKVTHAERMKGQTVFARFHSLPEVIGMDMQSPAALPLKIYLGTGSPVRAVAVTGLLD